MIESAKKYLVLALVSLSLTACSDNTASKQPEQPKQPDISEVQKNIAKATALQDADLFLLHRNEQTSAAQCLKKDTNYIAVTPQILTNAYRINEISANQKYNKKNVLVWHCIIKSFDQTFGTPGLYCNISGPHIVGEPYLTFNDDKETINRLANLVPGNIADFLCTGSTPTLGFPVLRRCQFLDQAVQKYLKPNAEKFFKNERAIEILKLTEGRLSTAELEACKKDEYACYAELQKTKFAVFWGVVDELAAKQKAEKTKETK